MVLGTRYGISGTSGYSGYSGGGGPTAGQVKVDAVDTTLGWLNGKLLAGTGITLVPSGVGDETLTISLYVYPAVTGPSGGSTNEKGSTVTDVTLNWSYNKTMVSASLTDVGAISPLLLTYAFHGLSLNTNKTYTVTASDGTNSASGSATVAFLNRRYYGINVNTSLTNAQVLALSKEFCSGKANSHLYDCTGGTYIWICYPASFGTATFWVGGLEVTFTLTIQDVTNDSGYLESFNCYRSTDLQHGSDITVVVV